MTLGQRSAKATVSESDLRWLACMIDCEGSISFRLDAKRKKVRPNIDVSNTNTEMLREAFRIMRSLTDRPVHDPYEGNHRRLGYRPCWKYRIGHHGAIEDILKALLPHFVGKREQAELMLRFIEISPLRVFGRNALSKRHRQFVDMWTDEHLRIVSRERHLNRRYAKGEWEAQRTTERPAPSWVKKRSALTGNRESQAEMPGRLAKNEQVILTLNGEVTK